jgi:hypothetical protein
VTTVRDKRRLMLCFGDCGPGRSRVMREFVPAYFNEAGEPTDLTCTDCGWHQTSVASGAAELCLSATWHQRTTLDVSDEYKRLASIARNGGYHIPPYPPNIELES